jgi:hypothetical protein
MRADRAALTIARGRAGLGVVGLVVPGLVARFWVGAAGDTPTLTRMIAVRDVALGVGALSSVRDGVPAPEWVRMGALADALDAVVMLTAHGTPKRSRALAIGAAGAGVFGWFLARELTGDEVAPPSLSSGRI